MQSKGFTIIELIITIFILSIAVVGIYSAFSAMVVFTYNASDQLQAAYLAQEGVEIVRNIRDTNWLQGEDWKCGLSEVDPELPCALSSTNCGDGCQADYTTDSGFITSYPMSAFSSSDRLLVSTDGFYNYLTGESSKFQRKIEINELDEDANPETPANALKVIVEVSWNRKPDLIISETHFAGTCDVENCVKVVEILYNWY